MSKENVARTKGDFFASSMASAFLHVITCHCSESRPARSTTGKVLKSVPFQKYKRTTHHDNIVLSSYCSIVSLSLYIYMHTIYIYAYKDIYAYKYIYIILYSIYLCSLRNKTMRIEQRKQNEQHVVLMTLHLWPSQMVLVVPYTLSILRPFSKGTWRKHSTQLRLSCSTATLSGREGKRASEKRRCKESLHVIAWQMLRLWEKVGNQVMFGTP